MCDYSLHLVASRPAKVGEKLVSTRFPNSITRGFAAVGERNVAVCLLPGTELAFEKEVQRETAFILRSGLLGHKVARFRQVNKDQPTVHHDALEFPDGQIVLLTQLCEGQHATVLQLPAAPRVTIAIGIVGALIGRWLLPHMGIHLGSGIVPEIIGATSRSIAPTA